MNIKLKYMAWIGEKHADITSRLLNSDIENFTIEFVEWLMKNDFKFKNMEIINTNESQELIFFIFKYKKMGDDSILTLSINENSLDDALIYFTRHYKNIEIIYSVERK